MKNDYLHLYRGADAMVISGRWKGTIGTLRGIDEEAVFLERCNSNFTPDEDGYTHGKDFRITEIKILLRPLSNMMEDERNWFFRSICKPREEIETAEWVTERNGGPCIPEWVLWVKDARTKHGYTIGINMHFTAEQFRYLLSRGFDLFGLIEAGDAIDNEAL